MKTITLSVTGMSCGGCAASVKRVLDSTEGVVAISVNHEEDSVILKYAETEVTLDSIIDKIEKLGYKAEVMH